MQLTLNKQSALFLLRQQRARCGRRGLPSFRTTLLAPDPSPGKRWTRRLLDSAGWKLTLSPNPQSPIDICVGRAAARPKSRWIHATVYDASIPSRSFLKLNDRIAVSCPELLFCELAPDLSPSEHLKLGLELCGGFSLDAKSPHQGTATMGIPAVTSVAMIDCYLRKTRFLNGAKAARRTIALLADNAWSPFEAIMATAMTLPLSEHGYGIGRCELNTRYATPERLAATTESRSRVPDIMVAGTSVGINYDGGAHLDLDSIAHAGISLGADPGCAHKGHELESALRAVRAKALDDIRRNRELAADGLTVFQVYREDLYEYGGLDKVMMQVLTALELREGWDIDEHMAALESGTARHGRQLLIDSMLPGR